MCLPAADTICVVEPCEGFFCDRGTIFTDCDENPLCAEIAVSANPASMPQVCPHLVLTKSLFQINSLKALDTFVILKL